MKPWDVWLVRASHVAQFGLFLLTAGTIYFTVIPLYQKALLDEQIARREIELNRIQDELDVAYKKIRASSVSTYIFRVGAECSGVLLPADQTGEESGEKVDFALRVLSISPEECLRGEMEMAALKELRPGDMNFFQAEVSRVGTRLEAFRKEALEEYSGAEQRARNRPLSMPRGPTARAMAEHLLTGQSEDFRRNVLSQIAVDEERSAVGSAYGDKVRAEVSNLRNINWPASKASDL
ncbi:hypothetical protein E4582_06050 [Luteimonas yindakuii]|uniref:Uncharacterized protein n=1 Tax=Luteimonas yindakuii TaxID=2565782 RepID=A0A4Z1R3Z2_9GAMM|nr:hypothetical protein [Luteimonas yindakuii]TKS54374.1 hypothetical protein E4582_06050 [Luteimonas yindakuii]